MDGLHFRAGSAPDLTRAMLERAVPENHARLSASLRDVIGREEFVSVLRDVYRPAPRRAARAA
ncbi:hypothetical protein ACFQX4_16545 [Roseomonas sp. GCM10028921]